MRKLLVFVLLLAACGTSTTPETTIATTSTAAGAVTSTTQSVSTTPVTTTPVTTTPVTTTPATTTPSGATDCPEVLAVELRQSAVGVFTVSTTVRSVDIEGVSYADAWEVRDLEGNVLGTRILTHPHANEQPFTRSLSDVSIPTTVTDVEVDARDSARGFCGVSLVVEVPHT